MSENNNSNQNIKKALELATESLLKRLKNPSEDIEAQHNKTENRLKKRQEEANYREEIEKQKIEDQKSNRNLRENYAEKIFWYMCIWSVFVFLILVYSGFKFFDFQLDKWVLVTLIGSTTASVFAIVQAIIEGLFKNKN